MIKGTANLGGREVYLIEFPIGDWSKDGHSKCDNYLIKSEKPVQDVREAHFRAPDALGFEIGTICGEYDERSLETEVVDKLREIGYDFESFGKEIDEDGNPDWLSSDQVVDIWTYLLNHIDPSLNLERLVGATVNFYGVDEQKRHLKVPGYGLFEI